MAKKAKNNIFGSFIFYMVMFFLFIISPSYLLITSFNNNVSEVATEYIDDVVPHSNFAEDGFMIHFDKDDDMNLFELSDQTSNGGVFNCRWSKNNAKVLDGVLSLNIDPIFGYDKEWACPEMFSRIPLHYGLYEASIQTSGASGTVVNFGLYSDSGDEIDVEFNGSNVQEVELNYWSEGINSHGKIVKLGFDSSIAFHTYAFLWKPDSITWYADGNVIWQTMYAETGKPLTVPTPILINFWAGTKQSDGWIGHLSQSDYNSKNPVTTRFDWVRFTPIDKL